jgi:hypothetical protein
VHERGNAYSNKLEGKSTLGFIMTHLASSIESMSQEERLALATQQRNAYLENIPTRREAAINLSQALGLFTRKEQN